MTSHETVLSLITTYQSVLHCFKNFFGLIILNFAISFNFYEHFYNV